MEIEVNEFVRIKNGAIRKIIKINEGKEKTIFGKYRLDKPYNNCFSVAQNKIVKHSKNIIDLIEVGDYVNGYKVLDKDFKNEMICLLMPFNEENESKYNIVWNTKYFIKSIVTKKQFSSLEYII